jgi:hypothetical protein
MPSTKKPPLKPHQFEVLEWIAAGCPDGVMTGTSHKVTAAALQSRRLVRITRRSGQWTAAVTEDGRYYLDHGEYAGHPVSPWRPSSGRSTPRRLPDTEGRKPGQPGKPPVEALLEEVRAAGGALHVDRTLDHRQLENLVKSAIRFGKVPEGKLLTIEKGGRWEDLIIRLADPPAWQTAALKPVPVPKTTRGLHQVLAALRDDPRVTSIGHHCRGRALRLLQGLIGESVRRGYGTVPGERVQHSGRWVDRPWLGIEAHGHTVGVALRQLSERAPHQPTPAELRKADRESWYRIPSHDDIPTDRLSLKVTTGREYRQSSWSDGKQHRLEDLLAQILQEIELRAAFQEEQRQAELQRQVERRRRWEEQLDLAQRELQEHHRAEALLDHARGWERASLIRRYLEALTRRAEAETTPGERAEAALWLKWCNDYVDRIDPSRQKVRTPEPIDPTPDRLAPFMAGLSPYGPP